MLIQKSDNHFKITSHYQDKKFQYELNTMTTNLVNEAIQRAKNFIKSLPL